MQATTPIRILLVDDQPLFRRAIATLIGEQPDMIVVGEAENGLDGVEQAHALAPDLVVMDVEMPVMNGVEAVRLIRDQLPRIKVVMLTVSESEDYLFDAIRYGAHGYLLKDLRPEQLYDMIRSVMRDETPLSPAIAGPPAGGVPRRDRRSAPHRRPEPSRTRPDPARDRDPPARRRRPQQQGDRHDASRSPRAPSRTTSTTPSRSSSSRTGSRPPPTSSARAGPPPDRVELTARHLTAARRLCRTVDACGRRLCRPGDGSRCPVLPTIAASEWLTHHATRTSQHAG